jgi:putative FmdB family regulatory protein
VSLPAEQDERSSNTLRDLENDVLTYAYECDECGEFEWEQSIRDPKLKTCPDCGAPVERLISGGSGFIMKGGSSSFDSHCNQRSTCNKAGSGCANCSG